MLHNNSKHSSFITYFLLGVIFYNLQLSFCVTVLDNVIGANEVWRIQNSPYYAKVDVVIPKKVTVTIEPGVTIMFAPGMTIQVKGTLIARGTATKRITFTKTDSSMNPVYIPKVTDHPIIPKYLKLVDGEEIRDGKLHIFYRNRWRPVCSQNREWSKIDSFLACNELGFLEGNFTLISLAENDTHHMMYPAPGCQGNEPSLLQCPGAADIRLGSNICNLQEIVGLVCWGANKNIYGDHWKGFEFFNSTIKEVTVDTPNTRLNVSSSVLEFVDILFAGVNQSAHNVAALSGSPFPPIMNEVRLAYNAYDAVNFTELTGTVIIKNSLSEENRGHGVNISSNIGYIRINRLRADRNGGNGALIKLRNHHWPDEAPELVDKSVRMCSAGSIPASPLFPFMLLAEVRTPDFQSRGICQMPITSDNNDQILTVSLMEVIRDPSATGKISVIDQDTGAVLILWNFDSKMTKSDSGSFKPEILYQGVSASKNRISVNFEWNKPPNLGFCSIFRPCLKVIMLISVGEITTPEVVVQNSSFNNNLQRGLQIENPWTHVRVLSSQFQGNKHDAGLKVVNGSADVFIHDCQFIENERCGLNITMPAGFRTINSSQFLRNQGHGIDVWNPTWLMTRKLASYQHITTHIYHAIIQDNLWNGIRFYNACSKMDILVNFTKIERNGHSGIETYSCLHYKVFSIEDRTNFSVGFSEFNNNRWNAIQLQPMTNMIGHITNSTFTSHERGAIYIDNSDNFILLSEYRRLPVRNYSIIFNDFAQNSGPFVVNVRLTQESPFQSLLIHYNRFFTNRVKRAGFVLNPRSSAHAVVVIGSSNVILTRNQLSNPDSDYEIATHLAASDHKIDATKNFWGTQVDWGNIGWQDVIAKVFSRIFSQIDRYTLAQVNYHPLLKERDLRTQFFTGEVPPYNHIFWNGDSIIGGKLNLEKGTDLSLPVGTYSVTRDVFIPFGGRLLLQPGTILNFDNTVGMFIQGSVTAQGTETKPIHMLRADTPRLNSTWLRLEGDLSDQRVTLNQNDTGWRALSGRVQVNINGTWGYVCSVGFDDRAASIVCNTLGLVAIPEYWSDISVDQLTTRDPSKDILISGLRCQSWDQQLLQCDYDPVSDHSCLRDDLAMVRCHPPGWAGVRTTLTNERSVLENVVIREAGQLDYYYMKYSPALQIDYNKNSLTKLKIHDSLSHGIVILHNDIWTDQSITFSEMRNNLGDGLITKSPWLRVEQCQFTENRGNGLKYDPGFKQELLFQMRAGMVRTMSLITPGSTTQSLSVHPTGTEFLVMPEGEIAEQTIYTTEIYSSDVNQKQQLVVDILDFSPDTAVENITIYDAAKEDVEIDVTPSWNIPKELAWFPFRSTGTKLTIRIVVNGTKTGRLALTIHSKDFSNTQPSFSTRYYPPTSLLLDRCNLSNNHGSGIVIKHYNDPANRDQDIFLRRFRENITLTHLTIHSNKAQAIHVPSVSRFSDDWFAPSYSEIIEGSSRTARIYYSISDCTVRGNAAGVLMEHNHVEFSNNVWTYWVRGNTISGGSQGGWVMHLPFVSKKFDWRYEPDLVHKLTIEGNQFVDNNGFDFKMTGYHARLDFTSNVFRNNTCLTGLISLHGMEKTLLLSDNTLTNNHHCRHIIEILITSQIELSDEVPALITRNILTDNTCPLAGTVSSINENFPCFSVGIFGTQKVKINRNIIANRLPPFNDPSKLELVCGVVSANLADSLDCHENYWGTTDIEVIRRLIFDFDDWNNFAIARFDSFLLEKIMDTARVYSSSIPQKSLDVSKPLGGRITSDFTLRWRSEPYEISSDLTVMPGITFRIDAGTTLQFHSNVGLLVLGKLIARGSLNRPIIMENYRPKGSTQRMKRSSAISSTSQPPPHISKVFEPGKISLNNSQIRLIGGLGGREGFVQFYNDSAKRWDLACDNQFSEEVGMVACHVLGAPTYDVSVRFTHLYDHYVYGFENPWVVKYIWMTSYTCRGDEALLKQCTKRLNYDAFRCHKRSGFVFLRCGSGSLPSGERYWGNIRLADISLEQTTPMTGDQSIMEHVQIYGAGMLHGERVAAIHTTYYFPIFSFIKITHCASNGFDIIAPRGFVYTTNVTVSDNLGYGYGMLILNGDSSSPDRNDGHLTKYMPLVESTIPYNMLGLLDMCDTKKTVMLVDRLLIYYKYSYQTRACTKLFQSSVPGKAVALRFLQLNLYYDPFTKNSIEMFNGNFFNITEIIAEVTQETIEALDQRQKTYVTGPSYDTMGVHVHASSASDLYGFIAEIITLPLSPDKTYPDLNKLTEHRLQDCEFSRNQGGGVNFAGVGEINPDITIYWNRFEDNGISLLNLTSPPAMNIVLQNVKNMDINNNLVSNNRGGINLWLHAQDLSKGVRANITNNVITGSTHGGALWMTGNHFNTLRVLRNFIANNYCEMRDVIRVRGVLMKPFSRNYIYNNTGDVILNATGEENLSTKSAYQWNGFYSNQAINYTRKTTVFCDNSKHEFRNNFFRNPNNNYELASGNRSYIKKWEFGSTSIGVQCPGANHECRTGWTRRLEISACVCYRPDTLDAKENWWGEVSPYFPRTRVWDGNDDEYLIMVDVSGAHADNSTVLENAIYCPPTWSYDNFNCFWYLGAPLTHTEARAFCNYQGQAVLAESRDRITWMTDMMAKWQNNYQWLNQYSWNIRAWIYSDMPYPGECPVVRNYWLEPFDCTQKIPFFCQKAPYGVYLGVQREVVIAIAILLGIILIAIIVCLTLWLIKSHRRSKEHIVRRQSIQRLLKSSDDEAFSAPATSILGGGTIVGRSSVMSPDGSVVGGHLMSSTTSQKSDSNLSRPMSRHTLTASRETLDRDKVESLKNSRSTLASRGPRPGPSSVFSNERGPGMTSLAESEIPRLPASALPSHSGPITLGVAMHDPTPQYLQRNKPVLSRPSANQPNSMEDNLECDQGDESSRLLNSREKHPRAEGRPVPPYKPVLSDDSSTFRKSDFSDSFESDSFDDTDNEQPTQPGYYQNFLDQPAPPRFEPNPNPPVNDFRLPTQSPARLTRPPSAGAPILRLNRDGYNTGGSVSDETNI